MAGNRRKSQEGFRAQESRTLANFHKKGNAESEVPWGDGDRFFIENPRRGGGGSPAQEGPRGREGVCGKLGNLGGGGGLNIFFSGPKCPPR